MLTKSGTKYSDRFYRYAHRFDTVIYTSHQLYCMEKKTYLEEKDLTDQKKDVVRSLYYEGRILMQDVADILGPIEAARLYELKKGLDVNIDDMPSPDDIGSVPTDDESLDRIPDDVLEEVRDED